MAENLQGKKSMGDANDRMRKEIDRAKELREGHAESLREELTDLRERVLSAQSAVTSAEAELARWLKCSPHDVLLAEAEYYRATAEREKLTWREQKAQEQLRKDNKAMNDARLCAIVQGKLIASPASTAELIITACLGLSFGAVGVLVGYFVFGFHGELAIYLMALIAGAGGLIAALYLVGAFVVTDLTLERSGGFGRVRQASLELEPWEDSPKALAERQLF